MVPIPDPKLAATVLPPVESVADSTLDVTGAYKASLATLPIVSTGDLPAIPGYEITGEIARGGMGRVLAGRELALDRELAIKVLLPGAKAERFVTESKITAKLPHPNIPPVHALGTLDDGSPFLAMKRIRGRTLAAELGDRPDVSADLPRFVQVFEQIAQAVGFAHSRGIIHRDLKPLNVMVGEFGEVQVMDWGLAKDLASPGHESGESSFGENHQHTIAGSIFGTAAYMPPEQARGEPVDARADVFALGATLMEILTGERPWGSGPSVVVIERASRAILTGCHETLAKCSADQELVAVARKCLSAYATNRYPDGRAVAEAVAAYRAAVEARLKQAETARAETVIRDAEQRKRRKLFTWSAIAVAVVLLAGTGISLWQASVAKDRAEKLDTALGEKTTAEVQAKVKAEVLEHETIKLNAQLKESRRLHDLARLQEAQAAWDRNAVLLARDKLTEIAPENRCVAWGLLQRHFEGSDLTLHGHTSSVIGVSFSHFGNRIITGSMDKTARLWNATTGDSLFELKGHTGEVSSVAFSPDNHRVITGSWDCTAWVWDAATGQSLLVLKGHTSLIWSVAFSPDGRHILTGSNDKTARVWDSNTGASILVLKGHTNGVSSVAFSPDGKRIVTGSYDETARVWDAATGQSLLELKGHTKAVSSVAYSPDGKRIVTGSYDETARLWDAATGQSLLELKGHTKAVSSVAYSPDGKRIVTGSLDRTARVWDVATGQSLFELKGHSAPVMCVAFSSVATRIVSASHDRTVRVWDAITRQSVLELKEHDDAVTSVGFSPDGRHIVTGSSDKSAQIWDAETGQSLHELIGHVGSVTTVGVSPDGKRIVTGSDDETARVWDANTGQSLLELKGHTKAVKSVGFSPDGKRIVTGSDETARVWDAATGQCLLELKGHSLDVTSVRFSPDGKRIVTGSDDKTARVWDANTGQSLLELVHTSWVKSVAFSPDGRQVLTSSDKQATLWDTASGQSLLELKGHTEGVTSVAFSPDGKRLLTGSDDKTARVWDTATGQSLVELKGHSGWVKSVAFSPDGRRVLTGSWDKTARVWAPEFSELSAAQHPSALELARRQWITRPQPERHAKFAEEFKDDLFARAVQLSLEERARGQLAVEEFDFDKALAHFLNEMLLKPTPYQFPELAPSPRLVK